MYIHTKQVVKKDSLCNLPDNVEHVFHFVAIVVFLKGFRIQVFLSNIFNLEEFNTIRRGRKFANYGKLAWPYRLKLLVKKFNY